LGIGAGTVTSSPGGINCGGTCSAFYNLGTVVVLTATPQGVSIFNGWTGCDTATGMSCTITMSKAKTVTANFLP
jgi:serine protease